MNDKSNWQPIETAPKDGTEVLGFYFDHAGGGDCFSVICFWDGDWRESSVLDATFVTHWMPLPEPPKGETE